MRNFEPENVMTTNKEWPLDIHGVLPNIAGRVCEGLICEGYEYKGEPVASAIVTYIKFDGIWHRLCFEFREIFWRQAAEEPEPWEVAEESWVYPHTDVGKIAGIVGKQLLEYKMLPTLEGSKVIFKFASGKVVVIEDKSDTTSYAIDSQPTD